jgi:hypothetical protein
MAPKEIPVFWGFSSHNLHKMSSKRGFLLKVTFYIFSASKSEKEKF